MKTVDESYPPGWPGISARWTSSAKSGIGKAINPSSNIIFTLSHGIVNEVYFPREDLACIRDMELLVTDGQVFFSEEKRDTNHEIRWMKEGVPAFIVTNTCKEGRYCIEKTIITDPSRDVFLQKIKFVALPGYEEAKFKLFALLAPHIGNRGAGNNGWVAEHKGESMLFAYRNGIALAMACSSDFVKRSVGYVGTSDGFLDIRQHGEMRWEYPKADDGNIALTAEIDISQTKEFIIAIGFGIRATDAAHSAWASLLDGFDTAEKTYVSEWEQFQNGLTGIDSSDTALCKNLRTSATVLKLHESKVFPGGVVASISIPWGETKGDDNMGGYHLVWPRDLVQSATGFLALNFKEQNIKIINYLMSTQEKNGRWNQNTWLNGLPHWSGLQMDEIALSISLLDLSYCKYKLEPEKMKRYWPRILKAISVLITNGPATEQDRWEEESGLSCFTLATEITALLGSASLAEANGEPAIAEYCRQTADYWNSKVEDWMYVSDTSLSREYDVDGYYMRLNPFHESADNIKDEVILLKNRNEENGKIKLAELICVDALALVRFGLRRADDPKIRNTIKLIDAKLKVETPAGPCWHRYSGDGYGEDEHGNAYPNNGNGIGRAWPLLTGERAHYEIAASNIEGAKSLLKTMDGFANNGLFPEQVWDTGPIPDKGLAPGKYTGSAMPLTWAHAEYIKLCISIKQGRIFDMSSQTEERYLKNKTGPAYIVWRFDWPCTKASAKKILRIEVMALAVIHWSINNKEGTYSEKTNDTKLGIYYADISLKGLEGQKILFTFFWEESKKWENRKFLVAVEQ